MYTFFVAFVTPVAPVPPKPPSPVGLIIEEARIPSKYPLFNLTLGSWYGANGNPVITTALHLLSEKSIPSDILPSEGGELM